MISHVYDISIRNSGYSIMQSYYVHRGEFYYVITKCLLFLCHLYIYRLHVRYNKTYTPRAHYTMQTIKWCSKGAPSSILKSILVMRLEKWEQPLCEKHRRRSIRMEYSLLFAETLHFHVASCVHVTETDVGTLTTHSHLLHTYFYCDLVNSVQIIFWKLQAKVLDAIVCVPKRKST